MKEKHLNYFNLLDALKEGCPICYLVRASTHKFMENLLYEHVNDPGMRKNLRSSLGFCNKHSWELQKFGDSLAFSIIYEDLIAIVAHRLEKSSKSFKSVRALFAELLQEKERHYFKKRKNACPVCKVAAETERNYISEFIDYFNEPELHNIFKDSFGLCLPHLLQVLEKCKNEKLFNSIKSIELEKLSILIKELKEFQRKCDYRFSKEGYGKEKDSWIRAVEKMIGEEGVF